MTPAEHSTLVVLLQAIGIAPRNARNLLALAGHKKDASRDFLVATQSLLAAADSDDALRECVTQLSVELRRR